MSCPAVARLRRHRMTLPCLLGFLQPSVGTITPCATRGILCLREERPWLRVRPATRKSASSTLRRGARRRPVRVPPPSAVSSWKTCKSCKCGCNHRYANTLIAGARCGSSKTPKPRPEGLQQDAGEDRDTPHKRKTTKGDEKSLRDEMG